MDAYLVKHGPGKYEAGHVEETPKGWEVRYERVDGNTKQGKVCKLLKNKLLKICIFFVANTKRNQVCSQSRIR